MEPCLYAYCREHSQLRPYRLALKSAHRFAVGEMVRLHDFDGLVLRLASGPVVNPYFHTWVLYRVECDMGNVIMQYCSRCLFNSPDSDCRSAVGVYAVATQLYPTASTLLLRQLRKEGRSPCISMSSAANTKIY